MLHLFKHQLVMLDRLRLHDRFLIFGEPRTGKSAPTALRLLELFEQGKVCKVLLLAPASAIPDWLVTFSTWTPSLLDVLFHGNKEAFECFKTESVGLYIMSYSLMRSSKDKRPSYISAQEMSKTNIDALVTDESHQAKNPSSLTARFCLSISKSTKYVFLLTGTPTGGTELDFYSQCKIADPNIFDNMSFTEFKRGYFHEVQRGLSREFIFDERCRDVFEKKLNSKSLTVRLEDVEKRKSTVNYKVVKLPLTEEQKTLINKLKKDFLLEFKDKKITAKTATTEMIKVLQFCNGHCRDDRGVPVSLDSVPKRNWLIKHLPSLTKNRKVIIWAVFIRDLIHITQALRRLGIPFIYFKSGARVKERAERLDRFRKEDRVRVIVAHPRSMGLGVDLKVATTMVWYSRDFSYLFSKQANSRNKTIEGTDTEVIDLVADGVDSYVYSKLQKKRTKAEGSLARQAFETFLKE